MRAPLSVSDNSAPKPLDTADSVRDWRFTADRSSESKGVQNVDANDEATTHKMSTARQSSGRLPRSGIPCRISHTGYATRRRRPRERQC